MDQPDDSKHEECLLTEYYDPVAILLSGINCDTENLTDELRKCSVTYDQLSGLVEEDLRLMGMTKSNTIKEILSEISQLPTQTRLYDRVLRNEYDPIEYVQTVCKNSIEHLDAMNLMLNLMLLKTKLSFPNNLLLDERFYASEWSLKLCERINDKINQIQSVVNVERKCDDTSSISSFKKIGISLILLSGAAVLTVFCKNRFPRIVG